MNKLFECLGTLEYSTEESGMWSRCTKCGEIDAVISSNAINQDCLCHREESDRKQLYLETVAKLRQDLRLYIECVDRSFLEYTKDKFKHEIQISGFNPCEEEHLTKILDELDDLEK